MREDPGLIADRPLVSVCLPTRDRLPLLRKTLPGVLAQTYGSYEVIVSDNWSSDGTREYCLDVAKTDSRVQYGLPPGPVGHFENHNASFHRARGRYISFVHDDDLYRPTMLARFVAFLEHHPTVGVVSSDWDRIDQLDHPLQPRINRVPPISSGLEYIDRTLRAGRSAVALPGSMIRREAFSDPPFAEHGPLGFNDHVTWLRIAEQWDIGHIAERLWVYRQHPGAGSSKRVSEITDDYATTFTAFVDDYLRRHPAAAARGRHWRESIRRYRFWALVYELAAHFVPRTPVRSAARGRTLGYALSEDEVEETLAKLRSLAASPAEKATLAFVQLTTSRGGGWPFHFMARNVEQARRVLRMD